MNSEFVRQVAKRVVRNRLPNLRIDSDPGGDFDFIAYDGSSPRMGIVCFQLDGFFDTYYPGERLAIPVRQMPKKAPIQFTTFLFSETMQTAYSAKGVDIFLAEIKSFGNADYFMLPKAQTKFYDLSIFLKRNFPRPA